MKLVQQADELLQHAKILYETHKPIMRPDYRILAEDKMVSATDFRRGIEEKPWWDRGRAEQAELYLEHARMALETVKMAAGVAIDNRYA